MKFARHLLALAAITLAFTTFVSAQTGEGKKSIVITKIKAIDAISQRMEGQGTALSIEQVLQALDSQVYDRIVNSRRFNVFDRSDADALLEEAGATGDLYLQQGGLCAHDPRG